MIKKIEDGGQDVFEVKCEYCGCRFSYTTKDLGYRLWYPHGFIYCPDCKKPIRHELEYLVKSDDNDTWLCACGKRNKDNFCVVSGFFAPHFEQK